jgi:hypothetical protein
LNEALNTKEHKKATNRTQLLFPGGGPHVLTDPMFIQKVSDDKAARLEKVAAQAEGLVLQGPVRRTGIGPRTGPDGNRFERTNGPGPYNLFENDRK